MEKLMTVDEWLRNEHPDYDRALSPISRAAETRMAEAFGFKMPQIPYRRYADPVALAVAEHYVRSTAAKDLGYQARLTNCGMSAIRVVLDAAELGQGGDIVAGKVLYSLTGDMLKHLEEAGVAVQFASSDNAYFFGKAIKERPALIFVETIGNGRGMPVCDVVELMEKLWETELVLVLDNTFLTAALFDPWAWYDHFRRGHNGRNAAFTLVYVESLSKHYRVGEEDTATAGLIVAPPDFIRRCDQYLAWGAGIQLPQLADFPFDLMDAAKRVMPTLSANAAAVAEWLRKHPVVRRVDYPDNHSFIGLYTGGKAGGVIYVDLKIGERGAGKKYFAPAGIPFRASFGHAHMTHVDFGAHDSSLPPGLIRLAMGTRDTPEESVAKVERALEFFSK